VSEPLLAVEDLRVHLFTARGVVRAVDGVGFSLHAGRSLASSVSRAAARR